MNKLENLLNISNPWNDDSFYDFNDENEKQEFKEWFKNNAKLYSCNTHYRFSSKLLEEVIPAGCYGNGQYISINNKIKYAEGIVSPNGTSVFDEYIPHGFNIENNEVIDYTYKKIIQDSSRYLSEMPSEYWGIEIPHKYINSKNESDKNTPYSFHRPLILQYWRDKFKNK